MYASGWFYLAGVHVCQVVAQILRAMTIVKNSYLSAQLLFGLDCFVTVIANYRIFSRYWITEQ